ncbi:uncharacterized protein LOC126469824 [Schistocerca serialis cubense]|uniref:uncharacterized protein LOC126469824 n=1 Tax=Schistocerca serialis cubense TaxID=2023355 RepID=UPI00214E0E13|nr:uncharacterized protein LOC126469824 [Schistocerca serialis cubense]XP_049953068.1 uncharacterized protein LOC126469824 [Schistocerca serialis cubense]
MATLLVLWAAAALALSRSVTAHREHKVHNIVLYPDKYSWCNITPIKQVVAHPDCTSVEIDNNVCVGTCFSYSIPVTLPSAPGEIIKPYCDSCQPSAVVWHNFTLTCQEKTMEKMVQIIQNCSCSTCSTGNDILDGMLQYPSPPEGETPNRNTDGRTSLGWMVESNEERSPDSENQDSTENERVLVLIKKNTDNEENEEEGERQDSITESDDKYVRTDNFEKETIKNLLQEAEMAEYYTEEKLNTLCKYYKLKENSKSTDTFKHDILNVQHKKAYTKEENGEHHHNGGQGTRHHHHPHRAGAHHSSQQLHRSDGQIDPTLDVSADQLKPATGGEDLSYIPSSEKDSDNAGKVD